MQNLGIYLTTIRKNKGISLKKVFLSTGITDSRLSKAENGCTDNLKIKDLKKLADLYDIPALPMCLMTGLFTADDIEQYHSGFKNVELLDEEDIHHIQSEIDYIIKTKGKQK